jgi:hypothetical protein
MNLNFLVWFLLGVFLVLFGVFAVTNIQVEWGKPIMGFSALVAGIACIFLAFSGVRLTTPPKT